MFKIFGLNLYDSQLFLWKKFLLNDLRTAFSLKNTTDLIFYLVAYYTAGFLTHIKIEDFITFIQLDSYNCEMEGKHLTNLIYVCQVRK